VQARRAALHVILAVLGIALVGFVWWFFVLRRRQRAVQPQRNRR
jgi:LPXTG-motif cell wall-anchored protein